MAPPANSTEIIDLLRQWAPGNVIRTPESGMPTDRLPHVTTAFYDTARAAARATHDPATPLDIHLRDAGLTDPGFARLTAAFDKTRQAARFR